VIVSRYVEGHTMSEEDLRARERIGRIAETLRKLHEGPRFLRSFDMFEYAERWLRACHELGIAPPAGLTERMEDVRRAHRAITATPVRPVPCHNDLAADNIIDDGRRLWIVDYEYSGNNDPCYDVGEVADLAEFDEDLRSMLCEAYFGSADRRLLARMSLHALIADVGWALWAAIQAESSDLDVDYPKIVDAFWIPAVEILDGPSFGTLLRDASAGAV
jgi:thiamine kinase-like enzyme